MQFQAVVKLHDIKLIAYNDMQQSVKQDLISITYSAANRSQDCLNALKRALRNDDRCESVYYINSIYMITKELVKMGYKDKALYYYKKGQDNLNQKENKVYEAKINIIYELLQKNPSKIIDRCQSHIHCLIEKNDLDSVHDLALLISDYFSEQECTIRRLLDFLITLF